MDFLASSKIEKLIFSHFNRNLLEFNTSSVKRREAYKMLYNSQKNQSDEISFSSLNSK